MSVYNTPESTMTCAPNAGPSGFRDAWASSLYLTSLVNMRSVLRLSPALKEMAWRRM
jgi:hypothetical protein